MRYIDNDRLETPEGWCDDAAVKSAAIRAAAIEGNREELTAQLRSAAGLWSRLKRPLSGLSHHKCWYCETREIRSDYEVDHFRPKAKVSECPRHSGYWWLALDPSNMRLSCRFCNQRRVGVETSGGKADHFPVRDESCRALGPSDDLDAEQHVLLDPTRALDASLLTFGLDGKASANPDRCPPGSFDLLRAEKSVELFHLNHEKLVDARKSMNRQLKRAFDDAVRYMDGDLGDPSTKHALNSCVNELKRALSESSELSSAARAYIRSRRGDGATGRELANRLLET